ncbi:alpha/beta fold hydrolase [Streptomyces sp. URMC 126]|uniref:alpha/beta fold hydrolase n=1 Tax=Streptomyces sp. URMC 126 TaxID=3423401 RepID=UPI003F1D442F
MPDETIHSLTVDGLPYACRVLRGPAARSHPTLLLGGVFQGMYDWTPMEKVLTPVADVVTVGSARDGMRAPAAHPSPAVLCRAVEQVVDTLGPERINLFGYSYGSVVAHRYALRHPRRVARLMLGAVPTAVSPAQRLRARQLSALLSSGQEEEFASLWTESMLCMDPGTPIPRRELVYRYVRRTVIERLRVPGARDVIQRSFDHPELAVAEGGLKGVPTLVFSGAHDTLTPAEQQRAFASGIEDSSFVVLDSADHWVLLERPAAVAGLALRHFTDPARPRHASRRAHRPGEGGPGEA